MDLQQGFLGLASCLWALTVYLFGFKLFRWALALMTGFVSGVLGALVFGFIAKSLDAAPVGALLCFFVGFLFAFFLQQVVAGFITGLSTGVLAFVLMLVGSQSSDSVFAAAVVALLLAVVAGVLTKRFYDYVAAVYVLLLSGVGVTTYLSEPSIFAPIVDAIRDQRFDIEVAYMILKAFIQALVDAWVTNLWTSTLLTVTSVAAVVWLRYYCFTDKRSNPKTTLRPELRPALAVSGALILWNALFTECFSPSNPVLFAPEISLPFMLLVHRYWLSPHGVGSTKPVAPPLAFPDARRWALFAGASVIGLPLAFAVFRFVVYDLALMATYQGAMGVAVPTGHPTVVAMLGNYYSALFDLSSDGGILSVAVRWLTVGLVAPVALEWLRRATPRRAEAGAAIVARAAAPTVAAVAGTVESSPSARAAAASTAPGASDGLAESGEAPEDTGITATLDMSQNTQPRSAGSSEPASVGEPAWLGPLRQRPGLAVVVAVAILGFPIGIAAWQSAKADGDVVFNASNAASQLPTAAVTVTEAEPLDVRHPQSGALPSMVPGAYVPQDDAANLSPTGARTVSLFGTWSVGTGVARQGAGAIMPCRVDLNDVFRCQDRCGENAGKLTIDTAHNQAVLGFTEICSKPSHAQLKYTLYSTNAGEFRLERERDWQRWTRTHDESAANLAAPALAEEDADFFDNRRGNGWGDRCYLHIKAGRLDAAEAACARGLSSNPSAWTEGAIWYNLGLIEEKRGRMELAAERLAESLAVRPTGPGVPVVQAALLRLAMSASGSVASTAEPPRIRPVGATASSFIKNTGGGKPGSPEQAIDGDLRTAWQSRSSNPVGEWIEFEFAPQTMITRVRIKTGFDVVSAKYGDLFTQNAHARIISILTDNELAAQKAVGDQEREVIIPIDRVTRTLRIRYDDVYLGTNWQNDLCANEVVFE